MKYIYFVSFVILLSCKNTGSKQVNEQNNGNFQGAFATLSSLHETELPASSSYTYGNPPSIAPVITDQLSQYAVATETPNFNPVMTETPSSSPTATLQVLETEKPQLAKRPAHCSVTYKPTGLNASCDNNPWIIPNGIDGSKYTVQIVVKCPTTLGAVKFTPAEQCGSGQSQANPEAFKVTAAICNNIPKVESIDKGFTYNINNKILKEIFDKGSLGPRGIAMSSLANDSVLSPKVKESIKSYQDQALKQCNSSASTICQNAQLTGKQQIAETSGPIPYCK